MDEQRIKAYINLMQQMVTRPNEAAEIIEANRELVDDGLLQVEEYWSFLREVLETISDSNGDPQVIYPLLEQNLDKLNDYFAYIMPTLSTAMLSDLGDIREYYAVMLSHFSSLIQQFPLGNKANNMEISINSDW